MNDINYIINSLNLIINMYQSMRAFFYQKIPQDKFVNNSLSTYQINYRLLLPASKFQNNLNIAQVNAQIQEYINLCGILIEYINTNVDLQTNLLFEQIQNQLDSSIATINTFAANLLQAKYNQVFIYETEYDMGFTTALYLNNINLSTYAQQASLNYNIADFNNILKGTKLTLTRG